ncbi:MAG: hypothetical protein LUI13_11755 [Lachnospiraceae bacterium]|nr:hypothetical protein [Lachnospiraceae bacterium]
MQKKLLKKANARQAYDDIADKIEELRRKKQELLLEDANNEEYLIRRMRCHPARNISSEG